MLRTFHHEDFDPRALFEAKGDTSVSVCLPARDEEATVGPIVETIRRELVEAVALVDEVVVVDDGSTDRTAQVAADAGARVVSSAEVIAVALDEDRDATAAASTGSRPHGGKGAALWCSLVATEGDVVAWVDADVRDFDPRFVTGLVGPLLSCPDIDFVKGFYDRPNPDGAGGGRVTELVARPAIALLHPHLAPIVQPLAGEYAGRRDALEAVPFAEGYGVDLTLLIDLAADRGVEALAQVDLGVRIHRNRSLADLGPQALEVLQAALERAEPGRAVEVATLIRPGSKPVERAFRQLPPVASLPGRSRRSA